MEKSMKKATLIVWVIIFGFIALFIFQNQDFFLAKKTAFNLNLGIREYLIPELNNAVLVLVFFCTGIIIFYLFKFMARFKAKLILLVIIFGLIALFIFQNQTFFLAKNAFNLNLGFREYSIPELYNAFLVLVFFFTGIIIAYLFNFSARFKAKRTIKKLNKSLKGVETSADGQFDSVKLNTTASRKTAAFTTGEGSANKSVRFDAGEATSNYYDDNDTGESVIEEK